MNEAEKKTELLDAIFNSSLVVEEIDRRSNIQERLAEIVLKVIMPAMGFPFIEAPRYGTCYCHFHANADKYGIAEVRSAAAKYREAVRQLKQNLGVTDGILKEGVGWELVDIESWDEEHCVNDRSVAFNLACGLLAELKTRK